LTELLLSDNQINDITPLTDLESLMYLTLSDNPISDHPDTPRDGLTQLGISAEVKKHAQIGELLEFGGYSWLVLDKKDNHALIITEHAHRLGVGLHNFSFFVEEWVTWDDSFSRHYLNNEFFYRFDPSDRARVKEIFIQNERNPRYNTSGGRSTRDKLFLLSVTEVVHYFGDSGQLEDIPDDILEKMYLSDEFNSDRQATYEDGSYAWTWLRTSGARPYLATIIDGSGSLLIYGTGVTNSTGSVRPVLWLNLEMLSR